MNKVFLIAAVALGVASTSAMAQDDGKLPHRSKAEAPAKAFNVGNDYKTYRFTKLPEGASPVLKGRNDVLLAGTEMTNSITGKPAFVSGVISVLMNTYDADSVAIQLGLTVERVYPRLDLVLFKAAEGTEMLSLRKSIKAVEGVNGADIEIVEERMTADVLR
ncbi:hypothetical protein [Idiomarina sp.]|uniref:hypothetical protein n=1 Tax=Idiomarina sp. TaxID=1874361 RepID=UPI002EAB0ABE|nr:hypothetical protein [Pseudomonadota bacterium]